MKTKILFATLIAGLSIPALHAAPISAEAALARITSGEEISFLSNVSNPQLVETILDEDGAPALYVYTYSGDKGFMLLPADDAVAPVVGYSPENKYATDPMATNINAWIGGYASQIRYIRGSEFRDKKWKAPASTRATERKAIEPLMKTKWNQTSPFNKQCPMVNGYRSVTGCVATAMAQVMKYWEYPPVGFGSITYSPNEVEKDLSMNFAETEFDWAHMLDTYKSGKYSTQEADAVATLMKACGYGVRMGYTNVESGAYSRDIPTALTTYFGYDKGITRKDRDSYSSQDAWDDLVYNNLANVGPVIYDGASNNGAHCFVCDGYDGNGYFHINWGWGGLSDGYFLLNELTPSQIGTGGHYGGYNMKQDVILGIMPPVGRIVINDMFISNSADDSGNVRGWGYTYRTNNFSGIHLGVNYTVGGGHVSSPLYVTVYETDPSTLSNGAVVYDRTFPNAIDSSDGTFTFSAFLDMTGADSSKLYTINAAYELKGQKTAVGNLRLAASAGTEELLADTESLSIRREGSLLISDSGEKTVIRLFNVNGATVSQASGSLSLDGLSPGVYIAEARDDAGRSSVLKLHLR